MPRLRSILAKTAYWLAVLIISVVLLVLLVLFFESRDSSDLENSARPSQHARAPAAAVLSRA
jgi:hypothetical protein